MSAQMHLSNGNNAPRQRELPKPDLRTELPRSDSFESLLSLNMLASSLLDEATDLEELSQGQTSYLATQFLTDPNISI